MTLNNNQEAIIIPTNSGAIVFITACIAIISKGVIIEPKLITVAPWIFVRSIKRQIQVIANNSKIYTL
jgi:hypothetical protein